jgi:hypothetical protein
METLAIIDYNKVAAIKDMLIRIYTTDVSEIRYRMTNEALRGDNNNNVPDIPYQSCDNPNYTTGNKLTYSKKTIIANINNLTVGKSLEKYYDEVRNTIF